MQQPSPATKCRTSAESYFAALFKRPDATNTKITASYSTTAGSQIVISASADMDNEFMGILGLKTVNLTATSTAKWGASRLRVALVLDTTGSMASDGKIGALITATKKLVTQLQSAASVDGDVYVSILPFAKDVRIENNYDATWDNWIYWDDKAKSDPNSWDATHGKCNTSGSILHQKQLRQRLFAFELYDTEHLYRRGNLLGIR